MVRPWSMVRGPPAAQGPGPVAGPAHSRQSQPAVVGLASGRMRAVRDKVHVKVGCPWAACRLVCSWDLVLCVGPSGLLLEAGRSLFAAWSCDVTC